MSDISSSSSTLNHSTGNNPARDNDRTRTANTNPNTFTQKGKSLLAKFKWMCGFDTSMVRPLTENIEVPREVTPSATALHLQTFVPNHRDSISSSPSMDTYTPFAASTEGGRANNRERTDDSSFTSSFIRKRFTSDDESCLSFQAKSFTSDDMEELLEHKRNKPVEHRENKPVEKYFDGPGVDFEQMEPFDHRVDFSHEQLTDRIIKYFGSDKDEQLRGEVKHFVTELDNAIDAVYKSEGDLGKVILKEAVKIFERYFPHPDFAFDQDIKNPKDIFLMAVIFALKYITDEPVPLNEIAQIAEKAGMTIDGKTMLQDQIDFLKKLDYDVGRNLV